MVDESKVLVIEDDARYRHDLETVLAFLGEDTVPASSSNWSEQVEKNIKASSKIVVAIIGSLDSIKLENLLSEIHEWESCISFVILGRERISNSVSSQLTSSITAFLDRNLSYQSLLDALHKSKLFYNHNNR